MYVSIIIFGSRSLSNFNLTRMGISVPVQIIASLGGDVKSMTLSPTRLHTKLVGDVQEPTSLFEY